jgi:uncharacterized protein (TIGR03083 family)
VLLTPRYAGPPLIAVDERDPGPHPVVQQRRRLEALLADLSEEEWQAPSRCDEWTVQEVVAHLDSVNGFFALSIAQGLAGEPTRFLASFDPVATPAELVERTRGATPAATFDAFRASNDAFLGAVGQLDGAGWDAIAESPPGHVPIRLLADHALWDSWVHERDIGQPLGRATVEDAAEVVTSLRYAAALGRGFDLSSGRAVAGDTVLEVTDPEARVVVSVDGDQVRTHAGAAREGAPVARLGAVPLLEMLSIRDAGEPVPDVVAGLTAGLATVFDQAPAPT